MEYNELWFGDLVCLDGAMLGVWSDDEDDECVRLLLLDDVISYAGDEDAAEERSVAVPYRLLQGIAPAEADAETVRALFRLDAMPWELATQGRYPFGSAASCCPLTDADLLGLIDRLPLFRNPFLLTAWHDSFMKRGAYEHIRFPELSEENLLPNLLVERFLDLVDEAYAGMDWTDALKEVWRRILPLRDMLLEGRGRLLPEVKDDLLSALAHMAQRRGIPDELRAHWSRLLAERCRAGGDG